MLCKDADPVNLGRWINRASLAAHLDSNIHQARLRDITRRVQEAADRSQALQETYSGPDIELDSTGYDPAVSSHAMFDTNADTRLPSPGPHDFRAAGFVEPAISAFIDPVMHDHEAERENLKQQLLQMLWRAEELDEFGERADEDDITAPPNAGKCRTPHDDFLTYSAHRYLRR